MREGLFIFLQILGHRSDFCYCLQVDFMQPLAPRCSQPKFDFENQICGVPHLQKLTVIGAGLLLTKFPGTILLVALSFAFFTAMPHAMLLFVHQSYPNPGQLARN
jgi:hypothetical protein